MVAAVTETSNTLTSIVLALIHYQAIQYFYFRCTKLFSQVSEYVICNYFRLQKKKLSNKLKKHVHFVLVSYRLHCS